MGNDENSGKSQKANEFSGDCVVRNYGGQQVLRLKEMAQSGVKQNKAL